MNDQPNMQEDFILNGNCTTSTNQELIDKLCPKPTQEETIIPTVKPEQTIPRVGNDPGFVIPFFAVTLYIVVVLAYHRRKYAQSKHS